MGDPTSIRVGGPAPYDVLVGTDLLGRLPGLLGDGVRRVGVVHATSVAAIAERAASVLRDSGLDVLRIEVPDGEAAKDVSVAASCWQALGRAGFTRTDAVLTVGGGATSDVGGFVAATWLRGVRVVHLPTTLLGMVDAAVGGKTGINTAEGKNLVGSFHEPAGVVCDLGTLASLPGPELASGLAEVVKCGFIADPSILEIVEVSPQRALAPESAELRELVERAIRVKADVVSADFKETRGLGADEVDSHPGREALNYGHTLGHAIERAEGYRVRHGEAISVGMVFVAELARLTGHLDMQTAKRHTSVLESLGLPTTYAGAGWDDLLATMRVDKKSRGDMLRFVVLAGLARPVVLEGPDESVLERAFSTVHASVA